MTRGRALLAGPLAKAAAADVRTMELLITAADMGQRDAALSAWIEQVPTATRTRAIRLASARQALRQGKTDEAKAQWEAGLQLSTDHAGILEALARLADAGIPLGNQSVLLAGGDERAIVTIPCGLVASEAASFAHAGFQQPRANASAIASSSRACRSVGTVRGAGMRANQRDTQQWLASLDHLIATHSDQAVWTARRIP